MSDDERKRWSVALVGLLLTWSATIVGAVWAASADRTSLVRQVDATAARVDDHEARLRAIEKQTSEIAADVRWIRNNLPSRSNP
jgi:hypothetical protein